MRYALDGVRVDAHPESWIADSAVVIGNVTLEKDASVWYGTLPSGIGRPSSISVTSYPVG